MDLLGLHLLFSRQSSEQAMPPESEPHSLMTGDWMQPNSRIPTPHPSLGLPASWHSPQQLAPAKLTALDCTLWYVYVGRKEEGCDSIPSVPCSTSLPLLTQQFPCSSSSLPSCSYSLPLLLPLTPLPFTLCQRTEPSLPVSVPGRQLLSCGPRCRQK